ncbi:hypothetical protein [Agrobacterium tumefaciens]|uniref:hypothetical protein n=1 Tax=Agrobacterium tumefaciens TaxID=358 RepID=UPI003BA29F05
MTNAINGIPAQFLRPEQDWLNELDMTAFEGRQFNAVYDALSLAITGLSGVMNQPRSKTDTGLKPAGAYLSTMLEFMHSERTRLIETLNHRKPKDDDEAHIRMCLLVQYEAECEDMKAGELAAFIKSFDKAKEQDPVKPVAEYLNDLVAQATSEVQLKADIEELHEKAKALSASFRPVDKSNNGEN